MVRERCKMIYRQPKVREYIDIFHWTKSGISGWYRSPFGCKGKKFNLLGTSWGSFSGLQAHIKVIELVYGGLGLSAIAQRVTSHLTARQGRLGSRLGQVVYQHLSVVASFPVFDPGWMICRAWCGCFHSLRVVHCIVWVCYLTQIS